MKCLITGGAGFIGSHLVDGLIEEGHEVLVVDNLSTGKEENLNPKAKFYKVDICQPKISEIFADEKPEIVFHYAAQTEIQKSIESPKENAEINILGTLNILENAKKFRVKKVVFASSVAIYGEPAYLPVKETHSLNPISPYPITKLVVEKYLSYYQSLGLDFVSLRYPNIYGPRQLSTGEGGVVSIFIDTLLKGKTPVIYGDGEQTRDFLYVADAVEATISVLKAPLGSVYNVGTSKETSINELYRLISQGTKSNLQPERVQSRFGEIRKSCLDYSKIKKELGWEPNYRLKDGLKETIDWFKNNLYGK